MKSKKPFFSKELIWNNMKRFWWVSVLYVIALFLVSPLVTLTNGSETVPKIGYNINFSDIFAGTTIFLFTIPVFIGVMVFRYMQNSKSMVTIHAMPYTRLRLYVNNIISGLILLIVPVLLNAAFLSIIQLGNFGGTYFKEGIILKYLEVSLLTSVTLYVWTVFVGMFTGSSIAQIIFTYILNFLFAGVVMVVQLLLSGVLYGFVMNEEVGVNFLHISPLAQVIFLTNLSYEPGFVHFLVIDLIIGIVALVAGYFVYKYRNLESAGDVISGKYIKPLFKYGVTVCVMLVGSVYVREIFSMESVNIFIYLIFALVGYIVSEMLLRKSFKIWDSYKGFLCFVAVFIVIFAGIKADLFGYEKYVPDLVGVKSVALNGYANFLESTSENPEYGILYEKENIEKIINLHTTIIEDKNINLTEDWRYGDSINISYQLLDGRIVKRAYNFEDGKYKELLNDIYNSKEYIKATSRVFDYTENDIYSARISNYLLGEDIYVSLDNKSEIKELLDAMKADELYTSVEEKGEYRNIYRIELTVKPKKEDKKTTNVVAIYEKGPSIEITSEFITLGFNKNSKNINKFIEEKGYETILKNNDNIVSITLRNDENGEKNLLKEKDKINNIMDILYNSKEDYKSDETISLQITTLNDVIWESVSGTKVADVKRIFE